MYGSSANAPTEYDQVSEMTQGMDDLATVYAKFDNLIAAVSLAGEAQQSGFEELRMGQHDLADTLATTTATLASMTGVSAVGVGVLPATQKRLVRALPSHMRRRSSLHPMGSKSTIQPVPP